MLKAHSLTYFFGQILSHWLKFIRNYKKRCGTHLLLNDHFSRFCSFQYISCSVSKRVCQRICSCCQIYICKSLYFDRVNIQNKESIRNITIISLFPVQPDIQ
ncbi:hypothetical protein V8G54_020837 [Vigna mungo]|uniref:Uncharacterized protein n=1 Tax=Vigna mungo TaxID=3915 RepID=A0AAQ3NED2_VIGMU